MAGLGRKVFTAGDVLTASDVQNYMMDQSVMYFAGTAARSSAIATPTTGMTSYIGTTGTASIPQLETYTGATWQTPYGATLVNSSTVTAAASVTINNVFTSAYDNYEILIRCGATSVLGSLSVQLCIGGTPTAGTGYVAVKPEWSFSAGGDAVTRSGATSTWNLGVLTTTQGGSAAVKLFSPFLSVAKEISWLMTEQRQYGDIGLGVLTSTTSHDGVRITFPGTTTGTVRIYGYRNS